MITIPDLITLIVYYFKKTIDYPLRFMESFGSWMHNYAWGKRWKNREGGTGYAKKPKVY